MGRGLGFEAPGATALEAMLEPELAREFGDVTVLVR